MMTSMNHSFYATQPSVIVNSAHWFHYIHAGY